MMQPIQGTKTQKVTVLREEANKRILDFINTINATNTAPGSTPFSVNAPGIDNEAVVLGAGAYYDLSDTFRVGLTYRGEFRSSDSASSQTVGIGASLSF